MDIGDSITDEIPFSPGAAAGSEFLAERERLWRATYGPRKVAPDRSAHNGMTLRQRQAVITGLFLVMIGLGAGLSDRNAVIDLTVESAVIR